MTDECNTFEPSEIFFSRSGSESLLDMSARVLTALYATGRILQEGSLTP